MIRTIFLFLLLAPGVSFALDLANARAINNSCALCHGIYGQGTPGTLSPRIAGLSADYMVKELEFYRSGRRNYAPMTVASSIRQMTDKDIRDISDYLAGVNLQHLNLPQIPAYPRGDAAIGEKLYMDNCKECHRKNALGKERRGIPPLAGQYGSYLYSQMKKFQKKTRFHDDDPEDEAFEDFNDQDLDHLIAFVTKLPLYEPGEQASQNVASTDGTAQPGSELMVLSKQQDSMIGMTSVISMSGMSASDIDKSKLKWSDGAIKISGSFRVTPLGEIILKPTNEDLRAVAGSEGEFRIVAGGILFTPGK